MGHSESRSTAEIILSATSIVVGLIIIYYLIPTQVMDPNPTIPNAKTFPYLIVGAFTLLSCKWFCNSLSSSPKHKSHSPSPRILFAGMGIGIVFLLLGYLMSTSGYLIGGLIATSSVIMAIEGERRWVMALGMGAALTAAFAMIFGRVLNIELPAGIFSLI